MAETIGQTASSKVGPLPIWVWAVGGAGIVGGILYWRNKKAQAAAQQAAQQNTPVASNLNTTTPVSNLTTQAQPMPLQLGDTFVNVPGQQTVAPASSAITGPPLPSAGSLTPAAMPPEPPGPVPSPPASGGVQTG